jgi:hypothetical protein
MSRTVFGLSIAAMIGLLAAVIHRLLVIQSIERDRQAISEKAAALRAELLRQERLHRVVRKLKRHIAQREAIAMRRIQEHPNVAFRTDEPRRSER